MYSCITHGSSVSSSLTNSAAASSAHSIINTCTNINLHPPPNPLANHNVTNSLSYTRLAPFSHSSATLSSNQPTYGSTRNTTWQGKSGSLGNLNEKTVPSYQRNKFIRKPLGSNRSAGSVVVAPETEYRNNLSHLMDTEAERNRLLARNGFAASEWRSDASTPSAKRILSAQGQRKDGTYLGSHPITVRRVYRWSQHQPL